MSAAKDKNGNTINFCKLPKLVKSQKEAKLYKGLLKAHCSHPSSEDSNHQCCGQITINRKSITMNCMKCGDARTNLPSDNQTKD